MGSNKKAQNIKVFLKVREEDKQSRDKSCIHSISSKDIVIRHLSEKKYTFDGVFPAKTTQEEVYQHVVNPMLADVLSGFNCSLLLYGHSDLYTSTGIDEKSKKSIESVHDCGIILIFFQNLFEEMDLHMLEHTIRVNYIMIYNEEIIDLLSTRNLQDTSAKIRLFGDQKQKGSVVINGIDESILRNNLEAIELMEKAFHRKQDIETLMNMQSGRSHTILTVTIHIKERSDDCVDDMKTGKFTFVDLASSVNIGKSSSQDKKAKDLTNINTSTLTLGRVITALVEKSSHVPFRESKLTRILQDCFGGQTATTIIATMSPSCHFVEETLSGLDYIIRARNIINYPEQNKPLPKEALAQLLISEIEKLRKQLQVETLGEGIYIDQKNYERILSEIKDNKRAVSESVQQKRELETRKKYLEMENEDTVAKLKEEKQRVANMEINLDHVNKQLNEEVSKEKGQVLETNKVYYKEESVRDQAEKLLNVAEDSLSRESLLYQKLMMLHQVSGKNVPLVQMYYGDLTQQYEKLQEMLLNYKNINSKLWKDSENVIVLKEKALSENKETIIHLLADIKSKSSYCNELKYLLSEISAMQSKNMDELDTYEKRLDETREFFKEKLKVYQKVFDLLNENVTLQIEIQKEVTSTKSSYFYLLKNMKTYYYQVMKQANEIIVKLREVLEIDSTNLVEVQEVHRTAEKRIREKLDTVSQLLKDILQYNQVHLLSSNAKYNAEIKTKDKFMGLFGNLLKGFQLHKDDVANVGGKVKEMVNKKCEAVDSKVERKHEQTKTMVSSITHNVKEIHALVNKTKTDAMKLAEQLQTNLEETVTSCSERVLKELLESENQTNEHIDEIVGILKNTKQCEIDTNNQMRDCDDRIRSIAADMNKSTINYIKNVESILQQIHNETEDVQEEYVSDTHKGNTPVKKVRNYPESLNFGTPKRTPTIEEEQ